tara:strand:+ start:157 stop:381 length:225 start_codon:yes stop_codon:yes gene_type:complete
MSSILTWIWAFSGLLLILLVLLHSPKGDGMGGIAASGSSMFTSASSAEASLNKATWTVLTIFLLLAVVLSAGWI